MSAVPPALSSPRSTVRVACSKYMVRTDGEEATKKIGKNLQGHKIKKKRRDDRES